jgi:hypothetical protein
MRAMPYGNFEQSFKNMTLSTDNLNNDILALDRGQFPQIRQTDDHIFMSKGLSARTRQADFGTLDPRIQEAYNAAILQHDQMQAEIELKIQRAKDGFIPTGGYLVTCDLYVSNQKDPTTKPTRARVPYESLTWLIKQLEVQGQSLEQLQTMSQGGQAQIADLMMQQQQMAASPEGMGQAPLVGAAEMAHGESPYARAGSGNSSYG